MSIGLNRSALLYPDTNYHCTMDQRLFDEHPDVLRKARFFVHPGGKALLAFPLPSSARRVSARSCKRESTPGYTVAYFALQLAVYMGFKEVFLPGPGFAARKREHPFFSGTISTPATTSKSNFPECRKCSPSGRSSWPGTGVRVFNCSPISTLECFGKVTYDYALSPMRSGALLPLGQLHLSF